MIVQEKAPLVTEGERRRSKPRLSAEDRNLAAESLQDLGVESAFDSDEF